MIGHQAIPRSSLADWAKGVLARLRARKRRPSADEFDIWPLHMHAKPRVVVFTDHGIFRAQVIGICLHEDEISVGFIFAPTVDCRIGSLEVTFGSEVAKIIPPETLDGAAFQPFRIVLTMGLTQFSIGPAVDPDAAPAPPAD